MKGGINLLQTPCYEIPNPCVLASTSQITSTRFLRDTSAQTLPSVIIDCRAGDAQLKQTPRPYIIQAATKTQL